MTPSCRTLFGMAVHHQMRMLRDLRPEPIAEGCNRASERNRPAHTGRKEEQRHNERKGDPLPRALPKVTTTTVTATVSPSHQGPSSTGSGLPLGRRKPWKPIASPATSWVLTRAPGAEWYAGACSTAHRMSAHRSRHVSASACEDVRVELGMLHEIAAERRARWEAAGVGWKVVDGPLTDKPASWLVLNGSTAVGQLTVWVSGEAEMDWGTPDNGGERQNDLDSRESLSACITDLEEAVGLS